jgi:hypothetical protein
MRIPSLGASCAEELTNAEFRLALIGLVDFDANWPALVLAAAYVPGGEHKAEIVNSRLLPLSDSLPSILERGVDSVELVAARFWFRHEAA